MTTDAKTMPRIAKAASDPADTKAKLAQRRAELNALVETENLRRAAATLDSETFDPATLKAAEDDLAALTGAEQELERRTRRADADAVAAEKAQKCSRARIVLTDWLAAIDEQELAARNMVDAADKAETARAELQALMYQLTGAPPSLLLWKEQEVRRAYALSALLHAYKRRHATLGNALRYGSYDLKMAQFKPADSWSVAERALVAEIETRLKEVNQCLN